MVQKALTVYEHIRRNNIKTFLLFFLFPLLFVFWIYSICVVVNLLIHKGNLYKIDYENPLLLGVGIFLMVFIWTLISYLWGSKMMLSFAEAKQVEKKVNRSFYNIVENTAIMAGLPMPKLYIIEDASLNAFTSGRTPKNAAIVVTRGLIETLSPVEMQGVIAHEIAHIQNRDVRLNTMIIVGLGIFSLIGGRFFKNASFWGFCGSGYTSKVVGAFFGLFSVLFLLVGLVFLVFGSLFAPLIHMAVSRQREYTADATGAKILHNPDALADALEKIGCSSHIRALSFQNNFAVACIVSPFANFALSHSYHPPVEERIRRLRAM